MDRKNYFISILSDYAGKKENCFDEYLSQRKDKISKLTDHQLSFLIESREKCAMASRYTSFTREDLQQCLDEGTLEPNGLFAQVCDSFEVADSFFDDE